MKNGLDRLHRSWDNSPNTPATPLALIQEMMRNYGGFFYFIPSGGS
jgi:hypothetical protein